LAAARTQRSQFFRCLSGKGPAAKGGVALQALCGPGGRGRRESDTRAGRGRRKARASFLLLALASSSYWPLLALAESKSLLPLTGSCSLLRKARASFLLLALARSCGKQEPPSSCSLPAAGKHERDPHQGEGVAVMMMMFQVE